MNIAFKKLGLVAAAIVLTGQQTMAWAQPVPTIVVTYAPAGTAASIPTLSEWAMLGLSLILAAIAVYTLRKKGGAKPLASVILAFGLALGGIGGNRFIGEANAVVGWSAECSTWAACSMLNAAGGTVTTGPTGVQVTITNLTGVAQTVTGVVPNGSAVVSPGSTCVVGLVVVPNGTCTLLDISAA